MQNNHWNSVFNNVFIQLIELRVHLCKMVLNFLEFGTEHYFLCFLFRLDKINSLFDQVVAMHQRNHQAEVNLFLAAHARHLNQV